MMLVPDEPKDQSLGQLLKWCALAVLVVAVFVGIAIFFMTAGTTASHGPISAVTR